MHLSRYCANIQMCGLFPFGNFPERHRPAALKLDLHATMLHLLGYNHEKFTFPFQGVGQRLTNITKPGTKIVKGLLA